MTRVDLDALRALLRPLSSTASIYLGLWPPEPTADTDSDLHLRWRAMAERLRAGGADEPSVTAVGRYLSGLALSPTGLAVFAADGEIRLAQPLPGGAPYDLATFGAPARVAPLLAWLLRHPAHVVVVVDRTGADLVTVQRGAFAGTRSTVFGPDDEVERNSPGGWSQPRYRRRAEDSWQHNAAAVADAVAQELHRVHGKLVLVAGDMRATQLLRDRLGRLEHDVVVRPLPGGRSQDGSSTNREAAITEALEAHAEERTAIDLARFADASGTAGTSVEGTRATLAALAAGRVQTLLVADDPADDRPAWFGEHVWAATGPGDPTTLEHAVRRGRMVDVAIRAGLLTKADVRILTPTAASSLTGRIGALCRYN